MGTLFPSEDGLERAISMIAVDAGMPLKKFMGGSVAKHLVV